MAFIENLGYMLIGFILIVSIFLIGLALVEKRLKIRFLRAKHWRNQLYIMKISKISLDYPEGSLKILDRVAKNFFTEAFHLQGSLEYSELENFFKKKNNKKGIEFAKKMTSFLYSGKKITKPELQQLIILLAEMIGSNKIITHEEKKELDKKSIVKEPVLRKIKVLGVGKKKF